MEDVYSLKSSLVILFGGGGGAGTSLLFLAFLGGLFLLAGLSLRDAFDAARPLPRFPFPRVSEIEACKRAPLALLAIGGKGAL
jgi:hypothetical protein